MKKLLTVILFILLGAAVTLRQGINYIQAYTKDQGLALNPIGYNSWNKFDYLKLTKL